MHSVIIICGIPGSGKSFVTNLLHRELVLYRYNVSIISFDDYERSKDLWDESTFKISRRAALYQFNNIINSNDPNKNNIIIIDDIMFLSSMRKQIFIICKSNRYILINLFIKCDLQVALSRNSSRDSSKQIEETIIAKIFHSFDIPSSESNKPSDKYSYHIDNSNDRECLRNIQSLLRENLNNWVTFYDEYVRDILSNNNQVSVDNQSSKTFSHQIDLHLRKIISVIMLSIKKIISSKEDFIIIQNVLTSVLKSTKSEIIRQSHDENNQLEDNLDTHEIYSVRFISLVIKYILEYQISNKNNVLDLYLNNILSLIEKSLNT